MACYTGRWNNSLTQQIASGLLATTLAIVSGCASAATIPNCRLDVNTGANDVAVNSEAPLFYANDPAKKFLTNAGNTFGGSVSASALGTSLSGTEASTSFVSELIAQRRIQEAVVCQPGYEKVGGICQPQRRNLPAASPSSRPSPSSMTSITGKPPAQRTRPKPQLDSVPIKPVEVAPSINAIWTEALYDYENRTGLGTAQAPASRSQQTSSLLFGGDHTFRSGDTQFTLGAMGSLSRTRQAFSPTTSNVSQQTTFTVNLEGKGNYVAGDIFDYTFAVDHALASQQRQTLSGFGAGLTASVSRGGFFSDGLFKVDALNLTRTVVTSDTRPTQLNITSLENKNFGQDGCISVLPTADGAPSDFIAKPYTLGGLQTTSSTKTLSTTATNFVLANTVGYHFDLQYGFWFEPLIGGAFTYSAYGSNAAALGLKDGQNLRLHAGGRLGLTSAAFGGGIWSTSITELVYSDVYIRGFVTNADGFSAGYLLADQGKVRLQSILTSSLTLTNGLSFFLECQNRFGENYLAYGGRLGARYQF